MPNKMNLLMNGLEFVLKQVTLPDSSLAIDRVQKATEVDAGFLRKNPKHTVLSQQQKDWDGENAALGEQQIFVDVWVKNLKQDAGAHQIESNTLLESIKDAIIKQAGHLAGQPFGAGMDIITIIPATREDADTTFFGYRMQLIYNVLWG